MVQLLTKIYFLINKNMQQKENFLFKTIVNEMYEYFIPNKDKESIDEKIEELRVLDVYLDNIEESDQDYENIMRNVVNKINIYNKNNSSKIGVSDLQEILADFWLDMCPTYKLKEETVSE